MITIKLKKNISIENEILLVKDIKDIPGYKSYIINKSRRKVIIDVENPILLDLNNIINIFEKCGFKKVEVSNY